MSGRELLRQVREHVVELVRSFSLLRWSSLCRCLDAVEEPGLRDVAVAYVMEHLQGRRPYFRQPLYAWWEQNQRWEDTPFDGIVENWDRWCWDEGRSAGEVRRLAEMTDASVIWIPSGEFLMGSPCDEMGRYEDEVLQQVSITRGFWMWESPVTVRQFHKVMGENPWGISSFLPEQEQVPMENVSWSEAAAFCNLLSALIDVPEKDWCYHIEGRGKRIRARVKPTWQGRAFFDCPGFRLPMEAEWEYACRAGSQSPYSADDLDAIACYNHGFSSGYELEDEFAFCDMWEVKRLQSNAWGLYDMLGNVWEWCQDAYGPVALRPDSLGRFAVIDVRTESRRIVRGGDWQSSVRDVRCARREARRATQRHDSVGFRVVKSGMLSLNS